MQELDHKHLVVTAAIKKPPTTVDELNAWLYKVVEAADMKVFMEPKSSRCDTVGNVGVTGVVGLETSHASIHVWESAPVPFLKFDVYSCKRFDPDTILECMKEFDPYFFRVMLIDRNDDNKVADNYVQQVIPVADLLTHYDRAVYNTITPKTDLSDEQKRVLKEFKKLDRKYGAKPKKKNNPAVKTLKTLKAEAKEKGLAYELDNDWYNEAFENAKLTWSKLVPHGSEDSFWKATVEQIVPGLGYTKQNCRLIPQALHRAKWKWHTRELEELSAMLVNDLKA